MVSKCGIDGDLAHLRLEGLVGDLFLIGNVGSTEHVVVVMADNVTSKYGKAEFCRIKELAHRVECRQS